MAPDDKDHTYSPKFRIPRRMWDAYGTAVTRHGTDRSADLVDHVRNFIEQHGNEQELTELAAAEQELTERRSRKGGRPKKEQNVIADFYVQQTTPSPLRYSFETVGGLNGRVAVTVVDAHGATHGADWTETRNPDEGLLWAIDVHLREDWAYPVKVTVDWAKADSPEERPVSSEEQSG